MSILDTAVGIIKGAVKTVAGVAEGVWHAITDLWGFLRHIGGILDGAWTSMVNGVEWFAGQLGEWVSWVYNTLWHIIGELIPGAIVWAIDHATKWAARAIGKLSNWAKHAVENIIKTAKEAWHDVKHYAQHLYNVVTKWANTAVQWVGKFGSKVWHLLSHPDNLAKWLVEAIALPLFLWFLRRSAPMVAWFVRTTVARTGEFAHIIEEIIARVI